MKITFKIRFIISVILLLQIISYSANAQSKKEQISNLNYQLDSLKQMVQIGQIKIQEFEAQLISVNKNLNELLQELMMTKRSLAKEDSLKTVFENEFKNVTKKLLLSEEKSVEMDSIINSYKVEIDELKKELTKRDSLISIYEKQSLLDKDSILLLNLAKPDIDKTKTSKKNIDLTARLNPKTKTQYNCYNLISGTYVDENCNSNKIYEWDRNNCYPSDAFRLVEQINGTYFDVLSSAQDNYKIIEGGLLYDGLKKIIILSDTSFITDDGCIWIRNLNPPKSDTKYKNVIGKPIKIGNIEIAQYDFPKCMNWDDAKTECVKLGAGWRLPTNDELNILYQNKDKIGGFAIKYYWSSTQAVTSIMWSQIFNNGGQYGYNKSFTFYVRAVRSL
jgi:hypothetical protein